MSDSNNNSSNGGVGVLGLLGIVFIVLKLCGFITWSWWWVTAPFWGVFAVLLGITLVVIIFSGLLLDVLKLFGK